MASSSARTMMGSIKMARARLARKARSSVHGAHDGLVGKYADDYRWDPTEHIGTKAQGGRQAAAPFVHVEPPASNPTGAAMTRARPTVLAVPAIAVEMPPPGTKAAPPGAPEPERQSRSGRATV